MNTTTSIEQYRTKLSGLLTTLPDEDKTPSLRYLARTDLYYLLRYVLGRADVERQWLFDRCKEVQAEPSGYLDLWAREHYKSTILTFAKTIQDILASHGDDPLPEWGGVEPTFGIFSHTRPIAKGFLRQIKREFEGNQALRSLFPDIVWENPQRDAPKWSEDDGIVVRRKSNPKESTVEAWGLVDGQPTSKHFYVRIYDDVVTRESVTSPDMIRKTTEAWELSTNLGANGGYERYIGTRYHYNDSYKAIMDRGTAIPRVHSATVDGTPQGEPVFLSREELDKKRRDQGPYTFACQMLQNPKADDISGFQVEWLRQYGKESAQGMNVYILVDPANEKKEGSDYTAIWVVGLSPDNNYYILDGVRDRLSLTERGDKVFELHREYQPQGVGYEKYGMQADIEYLEDRMEREHYRFHVTPLGGSVKKNDRIRRLIPLFEQGRIWLPKEMWRVDYEGKTYNLTEVFIEEEYKPFPVASHDDMLDALARITESDLGAKFPKTQKRRNMAVQAQSSYNPMRW